MIRHENGSGKDGVQPNGREAQKTKFKCVTRGNPCPVCAGHRRCSVGVDGLISCHAKQGEQAGFVHLGAAKKDPAFTLYRAVGDPVLQARKDAWKARQGNGNASAAFDWESTAAHYQAALTPERRDELAATLGVPSAVIETLGIGSDERADCWTFPETDAAGRVIGIGLRRRDGGKHQVTGGRRGLFVPKEWRERGGPLLLPEGASNTLALTALGMSAIGRPSNLAGVEHLAQLLADFPTDRDILVVGDFDPKPNGKWPGLEGCQRTAAQLTERLRRPVCWVLPPEGCKDVRAWTNDRAPPMDCADSWSETGEKLLGNLMGRRKEPDRIESSSPPVEEGEPPAPPRFRFRTSAEFLQGDYRPEWLVRRLLVRGQPGVIGGPKKSLKTTLLVELAYSLATGAAFLGRFDIPEMLRVGIMSGESGEFTLKETALRIAAAKNIDAFSENVLWEFTLPRLAYAGDLADLQTAIRESGVQVLLIDPLYLCVLSGVGAGGLSASNLFQMGPLFMAVAMTCLDVGCTPILAHHYKLTRPNPHDEPQLEDLAFAGIQEFARQWLLLGRRERFEQGSGQHKLWLAAGGSMGQSGLWSLDIDEGKLDEDFGGRQWCVSVETASEACEGEAEIKDRKKSEQHRLRESEEEQDVLRALARIDPHNQGVSVNNLREACRVSGAKAKQAIGRLIDAGALEEMPDLEILIGSGARRKVRGIRRLASEE